MILFTILLVVLVVAGIVIALAVGVGAAGFLLTFGDVILCILIIWLIIRHFVKKRKNKKNE